MWTDVAPGCRDRNQHVYKSSRPPPQETEAKTSTYPAGPANQAADHNFSFRGHLSLTTSSEEARKLFDRGFTFWENLHDELALQQWHKAANLDPQFAIVRLFIAYCTPDPVEEIKERAAARSLQSKVSAGEQLLIEWLAGARENTFVIAISAMNDLLQRYPRDKRLVFLVGSFLYQQNEYELAGKQLERALKLDGNYAAALNDLAYVYAEMRDYNRAISLMETYVALLPNEANPHDSYGEVLRMAGRYEQAIAHYRSALQSLPSTPHRSELLILTA